LVELPIFGLEEIFMQRKLAIATLAVVLFATTSAGQMPAANAAGGGGCSLANVAGAFGFTYTGVAITPSGQVPVAAVGRYSSDSAGDFVGSEVNSLAGTPASQTILGKITVQPDCGGRLVAKVYQQGSLVRTSYIHLQYDSEASEVRIIFEKLVLPDGSTLPVVITGDGTSLSHGG
jgi:hypothetical protein